jgi:hypothetical protein
MYYPEGQEQPEVLKSAEKKIVIAVGLVVACVFLWSWPIVGLPLEVVALVLCVMSLSSLQRRWAISVLMIDMILLVLTLINIGVRIYLVYRG